jgi:hypothetical protein
MTGPEGGHRRWPCALVVLAAVCAAGAQPAEGAQKPRRDAKPPHGPPPGPPPATATAPPRPLEPTEENLASRADDRLRPWYRRAPTITVGLGFHLDDGTMRGTDRRSILVTDETFEFSNDNKLYGSLGFLAALGERLRVGAVGRYFGSYDYRQQMGMSESQPRKLGTLFELAVQGEYLLAVVPRVQLAFGAQAGLAVLVPGGQFEEEIRMLRTQGASVWNVPRLGYLVGPRLGVRWAMADRLYLRGDLDLTWCQTFLYLTHEDVAGVDFEKSRRANVLRQTLGVSIEVAL